MKVIFTRKLRMWEFCYTHARPLTILKVSRNLQNTLFPKFYEWFYFTLRNHVLNGQIMVPVNENTNVSQSKYIATSRNNLGLISEQMIGVIKKKIERRLPGSWLAVTSLIQPQVPG